MGLFGKKEEDEEDEEFDLEDEKEERRKDRKLTRKFKDLNPEARKKRKEPPKPWGKKERIIVLAALLTTVLTSAILALSARDFNLPGFPKLTLKGRDFNIVNPFSEETIVLGGKKETPNTRGTDIKRLFADKTKNLSGTYTLYIVELDGGVGFGMGEGEVMTAASLIKLPIFIALYREAESGSIDLETKYTLKNSDKRTGSGSLYGKPAGTVLTYRELAKLMGKESDNTAYNILKNLLGEEKIISAIKDSGMENTSVAENTTTPKDVGILFQKLWNGDLVNEKNKEEIFSYLTDTIYENWMSGSIPPEIDVIHKYGREIHVVNDAGIIKSQKPFVLVIMSKGVVEDQADKVFPELARSIYEFEK